MANTGKIQDFRSLNLTYDAPSKKKKETVKKKTVTGTKVKVVKSKPKIKTKAKSKSHMGFAIFFFSLVLIGVGVGCLLTPTFNTNTILAKDGINVTRDELLNKADIKLGTNIFKINTWKIEDRILEIPYVKEVKVSRRLPDTIAIDIIEKEQYALIGYLGSFLVVDKYGFILEVIDEAIDLPLIYGLELESVTPGLVLQNEEKIKYDNIILLIETMRRNKFKYKVEAYDYKDFNNVKLTIGEISVDFGKIDKDINIKVSYLQEVLKNVEGKKGRIDLSGNYLERTIFEEKM